MPAVQALELFILGYIHTPSNANYNWDGGNFDGDDFQETREVGKYDPNPWGFFDMQGNLLEWTFNWWNDDEGYKSDPEIDPEGPLSGSGRLIEVVSGGRLAIVYVGCSYYESVFWREVRLLIGLAFRQITEPPINLNSVVMN